MSDMAQLITSYPWRPMDHLVISPPSQLKVELTVKTLERSDKSWVKEYIAVLPYLYEAAHQRMLEHSSRGSPYDAATDQEMMCACSHCGLELDHVELRIVLLGCSFRLFCRGGLCPPHRLSIPGWDQSRQRWQYLITSKTICRGSRDEKWLVPWYELATHFY